MISLTQHDALVKKGKWWFDGKQFRPLVKAETVDDPDFVKFQKRKRCLLPHVAQWLSKSN